MTDDTKEYIGDGIYAAFDGYAMILTTENGIEVTNRIVFEPREWASLERYAAALKTSFGETFSAATKSATELGVAAIEALKEEEGRGDVRRCPTEGCGGHVGGERGESV